MRPAYQKINEEQQAKIRAILTPEQELEHEKMLLERSERQKKNGRNSGGPGF